MPSPVHRPVALAPSKPRKMDHFRTAPSNKSLAVYTDRVDRWQNSDQRQRWVATALLEIEPRLNAVMGYEHLNDLREAMKRFVVARRSAFHSVKTAMREFETT